MLTYNQGFKCGLETARNAIREYEISKDKKVVLARYKIQKKDFETDLDAIMKHLIEKAVPYVEKLTEIGERMDKVQMHKQICEDLNKIYEAKNHDYGDSFARVRGNYPQSINIRLWDKLLRLDQLNNGTKAKVKDESIEDTLLDMANYCIMEVIERRISKAE